MSEQPKMEKVKKDETPIHEDVLRLAKSMQVVLRRRYPNPIERQVVAVQIMHEVSRAAA